MAPPRYAELPPGPDLASSVECYWSIRGAVPSAVPNRVVPDGCADLIVGIADAPGPQVVGTMRTAAVYPLAGRVDLFGIRFRPGGAMPFLDVPLGELTDRRIPLEALWGSAAGVLADALEAGTLAARASAAERVLRHRLRARERRRRGEEALAGRAVALLRRARGGVGVREVAAALGVGERRLERAFEHAVGVGPKALARVLRFRRVLRVLQGAAPGAPIPWAALAVEAGYADQPHLIREFRALSGLTPSRYVAERRAVGFVQYGEGEPR